MKYFHEILLLWYPASIHWVCFSLKKNVFTEKRYRVKFNTLREEILAGRKFGGFGGFDKNPPN